MAVLTARELALQKASPVSAGEAVSVNIGPRIKSGPRIKNVQSPEAKERYMLMHPDCTQDSGMFDCEISVRIERDGQPETVKVPMKNGRIDTEDRAICNALVATGYRWMNEPF